MNHVARMTARVARLPDEFRLAAACCLGPADGARCGALLAGRLDWDRFLRIAERQRLSALAHEALAGLAVPPDIRERLRDRAYQSARSNLQFLAESVRLQRAFTAASIPIAFLKGLPLAKLLQGRIGPRHSKDIDLLVRPEDLDAALRILAQAGYRQVVPAATGAAQMAQWLRTGTDISLRQDGTFIEVELHWRLSYNRSVLPMPAPESWVSVEIAEGIALPTLSPDDLLSYLFEHGARHAWFRLKWLADVGTLLRRLSSDAVETALARAAAAGIRRPALQAVILCALLFRLPMPATARQAFDREPTLRFLVRFALARISLGGGEREPDSLRFGTTALRLYHCLLGRGTAYLLDEWRRALVNEEDWTILPLPAGLHGLYPLLRLPLWLARRIRGKRRI